MRCKARNKQLTWFPLKLQGSAGNCRGATGDGDYLLRYGILGQVTRAAWLSAGRMAAQVRAVVLSQAPADACQHRLLPDEPTRKESTECTKAPEALAWMCIRARGAHIYGVGLRSGSAPGTARLL